MACGGFKSLPRTTASDKALRDKAFPIVLVLILLLRVQINL